MLEFLVELLFICLKCPLARMPYVPHILTKPITFVCSFLRDIYVGFIFIFIQTKARPTGVTVP
jgi:hypothetical protein